MNCVIVDQDAANRQELTSFLQANGVTSVRALQRIDQLEGALRPAAGAPQVGLVIVHIDPNPQDAIYQLTPYIRQHPQVSFFVMSETLEADLVLDAMHAGVKEFVTLPVNQQKFRAAI
jgi:DNA-binding NarL/FixJ family response regulator